MNPQAHLELLPEAEQVKKLRGFLHPKRSKLRPHLALFAIKNHLLREAGFVEGNQPAVRWYQGRLMKAGVKASQWNTRQQLNRLAKLGVVDRVKALSSKRARGWEYRLNEAIYPALEQALKQVLGVKVVEGLAGVDER
jgi:hypothetical protein